MPGPTGQHTLILQQEPGYEKGNGARPVRPDSRALSRASRQWGSGAMNLERV
jgi:hypothetical protein